MNRRSIIGRIFGLAGAATAAVVTGGIAAPTAEAKTVLLKRHIQRFKVAEPNAGMFMGDDSGNMHEFTAPPGEYAGVDLESPTEGNPAAVLAFGIKADGSRVQFTPGIVRKPHTIQGEPR